jgi:hypothetical protein
LSALEMPDETVLEGTMFLDGRFFLSTTSTMNLPGDGELRFAISMTHLDFTAEVTGSVEVEGSASIDNVGSASCRASADARGSLEIGFSSGLDFAGSISLDGRMRCYVGSTRVASAGFDIGAQIDNQGISGHFPYIGRFKVNWP